MPGRDAERPSEIPKRGWVQIVRRAWKEAKADNVSLIAAVKADTAPGNVGDVGAVGDRAHDRRR